MARVIAGITNTYGGPSVGNALGGFGDLLGGVGNLITAIKYGRTDPNSIAASAAIDDYLRGQQAGQIGPALPGPGAGPGSEFAPRPQSVDNGLDPDTIAKLRLAQSMLGKGVGMESIVGLMNVLPKGHAKQQINVQRLEDLVPNIDESLKGTLIMSDGQGNSQVVSPVRGKEFAPPSDPLDYAFQHYYEHPEDPGAQALLDKALSLKQSIAAAGRSPSSSDETALTKNFAYLESLKATDPAKARTFAQVMAASMNQGSQSQMQSMGQMISAISDDPKMQALGAALSAGHGVTADDLMGTTAAPPSAPTGAPSNAPAAPAGAGAEAALSNPAAIRAIINKRIGTKKPDGSTMTPEEVAATLKSIGADPAIVDQEIAPYLGGAPQVPQGQ